MCAFVNKELTIENLPSLAGWKQETGFEVGIQLCLISHGLLFSPILLLPISIDTSCFWMSNAISQLLLKKGYCRTAGFKQISRPLFLSLFGFLN